MKNLSLTILLTCFFFFSLAKPVGIKATRFKLIEYQVDGTKKITRDEAIKDSFSHLDLYFISNHFYNIPLPKAFINPKHKNEKVESSSGNTRESRRFFYTEYDKQSRIITYGVSGCYICSDLGYCYDVLYNNTGQVIQLKYSNKRGINFTKNIYKIHYAKNGDIKQVDIFVGGELLNQIILS